ncbi:MAG: glutamate--tRNA ligase [Deltaproteobacteria bacterium]
MSEVRVRFAPSPTGPLHIGGVRTALYNYLFARKNNGKFLLRIEDTDQLRYVQGAETYIKESLGWLGLNPDEGPDQGGPFGPYRQSDRKEIYMRYAMQLLNDGFAYYAFDTPEDLELMREEETVKGVLAPKYDHSVRLRMKNSLTLSDAEVRTLIESGVPHVIRLKAPADEIISFTDLIRGEVSFDSNELDDKVMMKADGMPTYHMANIVDDYLMKISHVIRGEEWLSSTAHHVLLYRYLGWESYMPKFTHLPLILKPSGKGKLSKRDGADFGFPVFPLDWEGDEEIFAGFREFGFLPEATLNFLALVGWNPGTEQEIFHLDELIDSFSLDKIVKSGAKFNIDKAKWFNQQYILHSSDRKIAELAQPFLLNAGFDADLDFLERVCRLMKPRIELLTELASKGRFFFTNDFEYDMKTISKKWKDENIKSVLALVDWIRDLNDFSKESIEVTIKSYIESNSLSYGNIFPILRIAVTGTLQGPDLSETMEIIGKNEVLHRFNVAFKYFDSIL